MDFGRKVNNCRMCDSNNLYEFLDLGIAPPSDFILTKEQKSEPQILFPLNVLQCQNCGLTQLGYAVNPSIMYGDHYKYESSITETGKRHFFAMSDSITNTFNFGKGDLAIDIGSNVGVLLEGFKNNGLTVLGIDPAPHIVKRAIERGIDTWKSLMGVEIAKRIISEKGKAKVISATNVFAHIDDKDDLMKSIDMLLHDDGIFVIEAPYLVDLIENIEYDTIYLEHLEYISIKPLVKFFKRYNMDLFNIERNKIHGKSVRIFVSREGKRTISPNVQNLLDLEEAKGIYKKETLDAFSQNVKRNKNELLKLLNKLKANGKKIIGISAPAKGNTILNYCKIGTNLIDYMTEKSTIKTGHFTPGMHIPIYEEKILSEDKPDYGIIFAWNFAPEIMKNNIEFIKNGGKFIISIPYPRIIDESNLPLNKKKDNLVGLSPNISQNLDDLSKKRIIVTGGAGFLGKNIVNSLIEEGVDPKNIFVPRSKDFNLINNEDIKNLFNTFHADIVIHAAAYTGGINFYSKNPGTLFYKNLIMGLQLMEQARLHNIKKFVTIGSGVMYSQKTEVPLKEKTIFENYPEGVASSYGMYNRALLEQSKKYRSEFDFNSIFLIPANLYGPEDYFDAERAHVIPSLITKFDNAKKNNDNVVEVWGSGLASREFLYIKDAANLIVRATLVYNSPEPLNIGTGIPTSVKTVIDIIRSGIGFNGRISWDHSKPEGVLKRYFDVQKMKDALGEYDFMTINKGIQKTISSYNNKYNN